MANIWAILVSAIAMMLVGALWYSKSLFGNHWMSLSGITKEKIQKAKKSGAVKKSYLVAFLMAVISSYILLAFIEKTGLTSVNGGMTVAFWGWLGFIAANTAVMYIFELKPIKLYWINALQSLVAFLVAGAILGAWA